MSDFSLEENDDGIVAVEKLHTALSSGRGAVEGYRVATTHGAAEANYQGVFTVHCTYDRKQRGYWPILLQGSRRSPMKITFDTLM